MQSDWIVQIGFLAASPNFLCHLTLGIAQNHAGLPLSFRLGLALTLHPPGSGINTSLTRPEMTLMPKAPCRE